MVHGIHVGGGNNMLTLTCSLQCTLHVPDRRERLRESQHCGHRTACYSKLLTQDVPKDELELGLGRWNAAASCCFDITIINISGSAECRLCTPPRPRVSFNGRGHNHWQWWLGLAADCGGNHIQLVTAAWPSIGFNLGQLCRSKHNNHAKRHA
jgi:hypothetical protein